MLIFQCRKKVPDGINLHPPGVTQVISIVFLEIEDLAIIIAIIVISSNLKFHLHYLLRAVHLVEEPENPFLL